MKNSVNILKLLVALILMMGLFSCATNTNGLVKKHCQGFGAHPHSKKHR
jgi:hypothetical protein